MKRNMLKKAAAIAVTAAMTLGMMPSVAFASDDADVVTMLLPPVSDTYQDKIYEWKDEFEAENPDITLEITTASWEDYSQKLSTQVNAGGAPDIAFIGYDGVGQYVDLGVAVDITDYVEDGMLDDFDEDILKYFQLGDGQYGVPAYCEVQCIGGNRQMLEDAGIDWQDVQQNGWTYDEFRDAIANGVIMDGDSVETYGFVFACSGVTATDYFNIFVNNAGMPSSFDEDLKYTYTSPMMLDFLTDIYALVEDGSMPNSLNSIDAGMRWNMFLTGQTMITGKGLSNFERSAANNNALIEAGEGGEVEGSIEVDYIVLPVPVFENGSQNAYGAADGYVVMTDTADLDEDHLRNVVKAMYYFAAGDRAAFTCQELYLTPVCETGREAYDALDPIEGKNEDNTAAVQNLLTQVQEARPDIPADLSAQATTILDEVITPKFQSMLGGETTPEEMYQAICDAAYDAFGEENCVTE